VSPRLASQALAVVALGAAVYEAVTRLAPSWLQAMFMWFVIAVLAWGLLPDGIRLTGIRADWDPAAHLLERSHWYLVTDDEAPKDLDGRQVELVLGRRGREGARSVIIERRVVA